MVIELVILFALLFLSGFFSSSETALVAVGKVGARSLSKNGTRKAEIVKKLAEEPDALLTGVLIGNNVVNVAASAIATSLAIKAWGSWGLGIAIGLMTLLVLIFGEIIPKSIAVHHPERVSLFVCRPLYLLICAFRPISRFFVSLGGWVKRLLGVRVKEEPAVSEEEVKTMLEIGEEEGTIEKGERIMMERVLTFTDTVVESVMIPKEKVFALDASLSVNEATGEVRRSGYSRIPVFEKGRVVGILFAKDLLGNGGEGSRSIKEVARPPYLVRETEHVDDLLRQFQKGRFHMAIVVGKDGGVKGLVTIEDLLEEIVGSISDEYDLSKMEPTGLG